MTKYIIKERKFMESDNILEDNLTLEEAMDYYEKNSSYYNGEKDISVFMRTSWCSTIPYTLEIERLIKYKNRHNLIMESLSVLENQLQEVCPHKKFKFKGKIRLNPFSIITKDIFECNCCKKEFYRDEIIGKIEITDDKVERKIMKVKE